MFYSHSLLSRKGPLGTIWIAAYCIRKLKRDQISTTDITSSVDKIMPEVDISHRVLAQLLLGIVKIFSKQVDYLYDECNQALIQIRKSFSPIQGTIETKVNFRPRKAINESYEETCNPNYRSASKKRHSSVPRIETLRASYNEVTITLPEIFDLDSLKLGGLDYGDVGKPDRHSMPHDELIDGRSDTTPFLNECLPNVVGGPSEYTSTCFTPLADVLPSSTVDVDLELSEAYKSSELTGGQKPLHNKEESTKWDSVTKDVFARLVNEGVPQFQKSLNVRETLLVGAKGTKMEENIHPIGPLSLPGGDISEHHEPDVNANASSPDVNANASSCEKSEQRLKLSVPGTVSPIFELATPAIQETPRLLRKRKKSYDQYIILSNKVMIQSINDASDLVSKRRKCPYTLLDAWRFRKLSNFCQSLMDPLIPSTPSQLERLPQKRQPTDLSNESKEGHPHRDTNKEKRVQEFSDTEKEGLKQIADSNYPSPTCSDLKANSSDSFSKENASLDPEVLFEMMEIDSHDDVDGQDHGWSVNTRATAQYLRESFLQLRKKGQEETLSLVKILEGKPRANCAKLFYEILTLKTSSFIDVKQDFPYSDVYLSATSLLESFMGLQQ
ncbi:hypothetical protein HPP92_009740 [Vanilla planifolia]|uniref:Sister chromatid cohesion 1 protein 2 n=1 Tax=Vanilla planifolia TaxID=51239 RepID=A0A835V8H0_VANPL|nr:hypothetical protein HPP92_009740 [Vanilla planifolia]